MIRILAILGLLLQPAIASATTYYASNAANNGYAAGNDSNNGTAKGTPFLTIAKGTSSCAAGGADTVVINPGTGAYAENSGGNGWLDTGNCGSVSGDPTLCGTTVTPTSVPTIQATAASRVINIPAQSFAQTLACVIVDAQSGASRVGVTPNANPALTFRLVNFVNTASGANVVANISGTSTHTYDRVTVDSSNASTIIFGWYLATQMTALTVSGGVFSADPSSRFWYFSGTFPSIVFQTDVNGALPLFTGTTGVSKVVWITGATVTSANLSMACVGTKGCIQIDGGTVTNFTIQNSQFTNTTVNPGIVIAGVNCTLGQINNNTLVSGAALGLIQATAEGCNLISSGNVANPSATNAAIPYNWAMGTSFTSTNDTCQIAANSTRQCFQGGSNGWQTDASNTGASTGSQNLGDVLGHTYADQFWTTQASNSQSRAPYLAAFDFYLKKSGSPSGNVTVSLYADSAGNPTGSALATSAAVSTASLTTSIQQFHFVFAAPLSISAATKYHAVLTYSGTINGTDYVVLDENSTTTIGSILTATLITGPWTADAAHALRTIVYTGYYGLTMTYVNPTVIFADATDTRELEGVTSGAINGLTVNGLRCINCGYAAIAKNTMGNSYIYNSFTTSSAASGSVGFFSKAAVNVQFWHNDCFLSGSVTGYCYQADKDSLSAVNPVQSSNPTFKDNIAVTVATASPYSISSGTTGTVADYNDIFAAGTTIDKVTGDNWAAWQTAGFDTHSTQANPNLANQKNPISFSDIRIGPGPVSVGGINSGSPTPIDATGNTFRSVPSIGAIQFRASCFKHGGRLIC